MERKLLSYDQILQAAKAAGIKENKLEGAIEGSYLPNEGVFSHVEIAGEGSYTHLRAVTADGGHVSLSSAVASAHFGDKDSAEFSPSQKEGKSNGKYFLVGQRVNPLLPANQAAAGAALVGRKFRATAVKALVLPFKGTTDNPDYAATPAEAKKRLTTKKFYQIELLD